MRDYVWFKLTSNKFQTNKMLESISWGQVSFIINFFIKSVFTTQLIKRITEILLKVQNKMD